MNIATKILLKRQSIGLSPGECAARVGISSVELALYECGKAEPNRQVLERICQVLRLNPNTLEALPGPGTSGAEGLARMLFGDDA
jgi:transcriptional regulator with XRE-family HTH domain